MKKIINPDLIVFPEERNLNKVLLFCISENIDWEKIFVLKEEQYRVSQIILAKLSGEALIDSYKKSDNSTRYNLKVALYVDYEAFEYDIERYYNLFSNGNLGQPLSRKRNKAAVITAMNKFVEENSQFSYDLIVNQTKLWISNKVSKGEAQFVPLAENFIYSKDKQTGQVIGSPLLDLLNDQIKEIKFGIL